MRRFSPCLLALLLAACQPASSTADPVDDPAAGLTVASPWLREAPPASPVAGGFLTVHNATKVDDRLMAVESDAAQRVEIHAMRDDGGIARMRRLDEGLAVPAGTTVDLMPGGYHVMFIQPRRAWVAGDHVEATLVFARAGRVAVRFDVRPWGTSGVPMHH